MQGTVYNANFLFFFSFKDLGYQTYDQTKEIPTYCTASSVYPRLEKVYGFLGPKHYIIAPYWLPSERMIAVLEWDFSILPYYYTVLI